MNFHIVSPSLAETRRPTIHVHYVTPGEVITTEPGFLRGHGTQMNDTVLIATVAGIVERVNRLISVRPMKARYSGEVGDVVICRVVEVGQKRWKVDVNSKQHGVLMLSSINLPGGAQRRRTAEDQLNMRQFYVENDLISAEVQQFFQDGAVSLHTRSLKYGKLQGGQFVAVAPALLKRLKQHFHTFPFGVDTIFGMNGYIWISPTRATAADQAVNSVDEIDATEAADGSSADLPLGLETREKMARVHNAILLLDKLFVAISPTTVTDLYEESLRIGLPAKKMLHPEYHQQLIAVAQTRYTGRVGGGGGAEQSMDTE